MTVVIVIVVVVIAVVGLLYYMVARPAGRNAGPPGDVTAVQPAASVPPG